MGIIFSKAHVPESDGFLRRVQRNAIHHFTDRDTGTQVELVADIEIFLEFLTTVNNGLPYP